MADEEHAGKYIVCAIRKRKVNHSYYRDVIYFAGYVSKVPSVTGEFASAMRFDHKEMADGVRDNLSEFSATCKWAWQVISIDEKDLSSSSAAWARLVAELDVILEANHG